MGLITQVEPRILTYTDLLSNMSFEDGTVGLLPDNWTAGGAGNGILEKRSEQVFARGSSEGSFSLKARRDLAGNLFIHQTTAAGVVALNKPWRMMAAVYPEGPSQPEVSLSVELLDAGSVVQETFTVLVSSGWTIGAWNLIETSAFTPTDADGTKFKVYVVLNNMPLTEVIHIDYLHFGLCSDFDRRFGVWEPEDEPRGTVNIGDTAFESVKLAEPMSSITFGHKRVLEGRPRDDAWLDFLRAAMQFRVFSIWRDASVWTNEGGHYQNCVLTGKVKYRYQPGVARYPMEVEAVTPLERRLSGHVLS